MSDGTEITTHAGQTVYMKLVGYDKPFFTALAVIGAIAAGIMAYNADKDAKLAQYYAVDLKVYMAQHGLNPPQPPWFPPPGEKK